MMRFIFALLLSVSAQAGGLVGNGGDAVFCRPSDKNPFDGYYSLDYLAQYTPDFKVVETKTLDESLDRIEKILKEKLPEVATNFHEFRANIFNVTDPSKKYFWEKAPFGLVDLVDESVVALLPENCRDEEEIKIVQAVIRMKSLHSGWPSDKVLFKYVPEVVDNLEVKNATQLSFLIVHEWLWNYSEDVLKNRRVNYWLHSSAFDKWSREDILKNFEAIRFILDGPFDTDLNTHRLFNSDLCLPSKITSKKMSILAQRYVGGRSLIVSDGGETIQRSRLCNTDKGECNSYYSEVAPLTQTGTVDFRGEVRLVLRDGKIEVRSAEQGGDYLHFTCPFDENGQPLPCDRLKDASGKFYPVKVEYTPIIGVDCVRFYARGTIPMSPTLPEFLNFMEFVVYFQTYIEQYL